MSKTHSPTSEKSKAPAPPLGMAVLTRVEAATFMGVSLGAFGVWERDGRVTIPRYRLTELAGRPIVYTVEDLTRLREEFRKLEAPHPDPERPGVYRVPIRSRTQHLEALIDAEDLPKVAGKNWNIARRSDGRDMEVVLSSVTERVVPLKRIIMGVEAPEHKERIVGFANGDPLDCRRGNLVMKTRSEANIKKTKPATRAGRPASSKYKGVLWDAGRRLWKAQIGRGENHRPLGRFRDEAQAAAAYDSAAREIFGAAAVLNFPDGIVPAPTFLGPDGEIVREKHAYRVPRGLPTPPPGAAMLTREEAAAALDVSVRTLGEWERAGGVSIPRYRMKAHTGTPILYVAADIARLRDELDAVGQPYPDPHPARAGVWRVPLRTLSGYVEALIDEVDLPIVRGRKWSLTVHSGPRLNKGVVVQSGARDIARSQLRRFIMGLEGEGPTKRIVHANGNPLDCRRANLVVSSPEKSTRGGYKLLHRCGRPTTSRFKGVCWIEREGAWQAQIRIDDRPKRLGLFEDEEDAAFAYDEAARAVWGSEARVNFPGPGELPSAAAPVAPEYLWAEGKGPMARPPGKPADFSAVLNEDGSVTLSWRCANAAASAGVSFTVSRRLPGQTAFVQIGAAAGTTSRTRRPTFTDATIPAADLFGQEKIAEYLVRACRGADVGETGDVLAVRLGRGGSSIMHTMPGQAA